MSEHRDAVSCHHNKFLGLRLCSASNLLFLNVSNSVFFWSYSAKKNKFLFFFDGFRREAPGFFDVLAFFFEENRPRSGQRFFLRFFLAVRREAPGFFLKVVYFFLKSIGDQL